MQFQRFINGGFCLHKLRGYWKGHVSAWFDRNGELLDAEHVPIPFGSSRPIQRGKRMWRELQAQGRRWKNIPVE